MGVGEDAGRQHAGSGGASEDKFRGNVKRGPPRLKLGQWQVVGEPTKRKEPRWDWDILSPSLAFSGAYLGKKCYNSRTI